MKEIEDERRVDAETLVPVLNIKEDHEGDAVRAEVEPCPAGDGAKETAIALHTGTEEVRTSLDDPEEFTQWELGMEECPKHNLEQEYADDYEDDCRNYEYHGHYNLKEYGPASELFTPNWPINASNIFGLLLRFSEVSFGESRYKHYDIGHTLWGEVRYRVWKELLKQGLPPSDADRLMKDAGEFSFNSFWNFHIRSGSTQFADNLYEAECDRYLRDIKAECQGHNTDDKDTKATVIDDLASPNTHLDFFADEVEELVMAFAHSCRALAQQHGSRHSGGGYDEKAESIIRTSTHDVKWNLCRALDHLSRLTDTLTREAIDAANSNGGLSNAQMHSDQATAITEVEL